MPSRIHSVTVDCADPATLSRFWAAVLGYKITYQEGDEVEIDAPGGGRAILFGRVGDAKTVKNRIHFDLAPDDQQAEVERVRALGAREVDIGQGNVSWVVMVDPEGNEFCILTAR